MKHQFITKIALLITLLTYSGNLHASNTPQFSQKLINAAMQQTRSYVTYDSGYRKIAYPNGDVAPEYGVCADVIVRAYRGLGIDLQKLVHEDMQKDFKAYPQLWSLKGPDSNIDHRRVPNLRTFFTRHGKSIPVTDNADDYKPGDIVSFNVSSRGSLPHIGIVSDQKTSFRHHPLIIHNIGHGVNAEDVLFDFKITGHYRYEG